MALAGGAQPHVKGDRVGIIRLAALVQQSTAGSEPIPETFAKVRAAALEAAGRSPSPAGRAAPILAGSTEGRPRLTEPWFC